MLGSTQQAATIAALPPEKLVLNRRPLEEKVSTVPAALLQTQELQRGSSLCVGRTLPNLCPSC